MLGVPKVVTHKNTSLTQNKQVTEQSAGYDLTQKAFFLLNVVVTFILISLTSFRLTSLPMMQQWDNNKEL